jgi:hypothetical protein
LGFGWLNDELLAFLDVYVLTILEPDKPEFSTFVHCDGFARLDVYAENIARVVNVVAPQEFNHDIAIIAEI